MLSITLNGKVYRMTKDAAGRMLFTVETGPRTSAPADPEIVERLLAGFLVPSIKTAT